MACYSNYLLGSLARHSKNSFMYDSIEIRNLEGIPMDVLNQTSNQAFSDYFVPVSTTVDELTERLTSCSFDPKWSTGAFKGEKLIGFILHGRKESEEKTTLYNCGTGVIPSERGQALTIKQYQELMPQIEADGIGQIRLEVISTNTAAIHAYEKSGFMVINKLCCFKGKVRTIKPVKDLTFEEDVNPDWEVLEQMWDWKPSWQNANLAMQLSMDVHVFVWAKLNGQPAGYAIYHPKTARITQFAIAPNHRMKGTGHALFYHIQHQLDQELSLINIDSGAQGTLSFLKHIGLRPFLEQYDMELLV